MCFYVSERQSLAVCKGSVKKCNHSEATVFSQWPRNVRQVEIRIAMRIDTVSVPCRLCTWVRVTRA